MKRTVTVRLWPLASRTSTFAPSRSRVQTSRTKRSTPNRVSTLWNSSLRLLARDKSLALDDAGVIVAAFVGGGHLDEDAYVV